MQTIIIFVLYLVAINTQEDTQSQSTNQQKYDQLFEWLRQGNAQVDKVQIIEHEPDNRGLIAKTFIRQNEEVLFIPISHFLFTKDVKQTCTINRRMIQLNIKPNQDHTYFAIHMMQEIRRKNSFWQPYLQVLPKDTSSFPINFSNEELKEFDGSKLVQDINSQRYNLKSEFDRISREVPEFSKYKYEDFLYYRLMAQSRILTIVLDNEWEQVLVPMADMINHSPQNNLEYRYAKDRQGFIVTATRHIQQGEELFIQYGQQGNKYLLINYGFTSDKVKEIKYEFEVCDDRKNPLYVTRTQFLQNGVCHRGQINGDPSSQVTRETYALFRIKSASKLNHWMQLEQSIESLNLYGELAIYLNRPTSPSYEKKNWQFLKQTFQHFLNTKFKTTWEQDQEILKGNLSKNMRSVITVRQKEKELLKKYIELSDHVVDLLGDPVHIIREKLGRKHELSGIRAWIEEYIIPLKV